MRETGAPGHTIVSVFESETDVSRYEKERQQRRQQQSDAQAAESSDEQLPAGVRRVVGPLRRELINYCDAEGT